MIDIWKQLNKLNPSTLVCDEFFVKNRASVFSKEFTRGKNNLK